MTRGFERGWKDKDGVIGGSQHPLIKKLLKITVKSADVRIKRVILWKRYEIWIEVESERKIKRNKIIPEIKKEIKNALKEYFKEEINYVKVKEDSDKSEEVVIKKQIIFKDCKIFDSPNNCIEDQPEIVKKLFEIPGIIEIEVWSANEITEIILRKGELFDWNEVLSDVKKLLNESKEIIERDAAIVKKRERLLLKEIKKAIPNPNLPVLSLSTEGDCEGKSVKHLGIFNGRIEDIIRNVSDSIMYTLLMIIYPTPSEMICRVRDRGMPSISFVPPIPKKGKKVRVQFYCKKDLEKFIELLLPETQYEIDRDDVIVEV